MTKLKRARERLHPAATITEEGIRARYLNICGLEHNEAFFANLVVIVEGETEQLALPVYAKALGLDFDARGVSVVLARGKTNIDQFFHLYDNFGIPVYIVFDNDRGGEPRDLTWNEILLRMLGLPPEQNPVAGAYERHTVVEGTFEKAMKAFLDAQEEGLYDRLCSTAAELLGGGAGKGVVARFMAQQLTDATSERGVLIPQFVQDLVARLRHQLPDRPSINAAV